MTEDELNEIRIGKLRDLVSKEETKVDFCKKWSKNPDEKPLDPTYVSQLLNGYRSFGEKSARRFERTMYLPNKYFDDDSDDLYTSIGRTKETTSVADLNRVKEFLSLTIEQQNRLLAMAKEEKTGRGEKTRAKEESK